MVKATFYCNILDPDDNISEHDFDFDSFICSDRQELDEYIKKNGYVVGECCGYWGDSMGVLTDIFIDEDYPYTE